MSCLLPALLGLLVFLICERLLLEQRIHSIPLRISVTGTRGKTTVVRLLASILREDGRRVVAKTTGSRPVYILPDGTEEIIRRRGVTSIIEQKKLMRLAVRQNADCLVTEIMSLHPENHTVESQRLIKPHVVVVTNVRVDHIDAMGHTEDQMATVYGLDIPAGARVIIPESEMREPFERAACRASADLITVVDGKGNGIGAVEGLNFIENVDLARRAARQLDVDENTIERGIASAGRDIGALRIWRYSAEGGHECYLVNGFAANDPDSTSRIITALPEIVPRMTGKPIGLLSLRADRGDRTLQWMRELQSGLRDRFSRIFVTGSHSVAMSRKVTGLVAVRKSDPESITRALTSEVDDGAVIVGMGNIVGGGEEMISYWQSIGTEYGL